MDPQRPTAEVIVISDGRIIDIGDAQLAKAYPTAVHHDIGGAMLIPAFIDAHCHLSIVALQPLWGDCSATRTIDELQQLLEQQARRKPQAEWIRADSWDELVTGLMFDRHDLDAVTGDQPAIVMHSTYHQCVLNSAGLENLGIGREAARRDPLIVADDRGDPTGLVLERSAGRAHSASMRSYTDPDRWAEHIERRATHLLSLGITAVHDAACDPATEAVYATMARAGQLPISVLAMPHPDPFLTNAFGDRLDGAPTGSGDETLRVGPLKFFADGGAAPAFDVHLGGERLVMGYRHPDLLSELKLAVERGFRVGVHAMGNQGVADTVEAFRQASRVRRDDDHRFRIEHVGMASPALAREAVEVGAVGVVQPGFVEHVGRSAGEFQPDDASWLPFATLADAGLVLAGSSDDPCGPVNPLECARFGEHRRSEGIVFGADQSVSTDDWLTAYTAGSAFAGGQEHERGSLTVGKVADLVVLGEQGDGPRELSVLETWARGRLVHVADDN